MVVDLGEIDRQLDTRVVLSYAGNESMAEFTKRFKISFQSGLRVSNDKMKLTFFIPGEIRTHREVSMLLSQADSVKEGNAYFLNYPVRNDMLQEAISNIIFEGKTVVIDNLLLQDGVYLLSMRLHSSEMGSFSDRTLKYTRSLPGLGITHLGPSPGIPTILKEIGNSVYLKNFEFEVEVPEKIRESSLLSVLPDEWAGENRYLKSGGHPPELIVTNSKMPDAEENGIGVISHDKRLYSVQFGELLEFMRLYYDRVYSSGIIRFWRGLHYRNGILKFGSVIPEQLSDAYTRVLSNCNDEFPEWNLVITNIDAA